MVTVVVLAIRCWREV